MAVNKREDLEKILRVDPAITFEVTEDLLQLCGLLGSQQTLLQSLYKAYRFNQASFETKPKIGAPFSAQFDYENEKVTLKRLQLQCKLPMKEFLRLLGLIDATYGEILPLGTVIEADTELLDIGITSSSPLELVIMGRKFELNAPFEGFVVDYLAELYPFGMSQSSPLWVSNMMIKRISAMGPKMPSELSFEDDLRALQLKNGQISSAFMSNEESDALYQTYFSENEA